MQGQVEYAAAGENTFYYNGVMFNPTTELVAARYTDTRTAPIVQNTNGWQVGLARFAMGGASARYPVWSGIPRTGTSGTGFVATTTTITNGVPGTGTGTVLVVPQMQMIEAVKVGTVVAYLQKSQVDASPGAPSADSIDAFKGYSVTEFGASLQAALRTASLPDYGTGSYSGTMYDPLPTVTYSSGGGVFTISLNAAVADGLRGTNTAYGHLYPEDRLPVIWFNRELYRRCPFPLRYTDGTWFMLDLRCPNPGWLNTFQLGAGTSGTAGTGSSLDPAVLAYSQEVSQVSNWIPYIGLAVTTNSMQVVPEQSGYVSGALTAANNNSSTLPIVFDFVFTGGEDYLAGVDLTPNFIRWADMMGGPLRSIDLTFWFSGPDGTLTPLQLEPGTGFSFKLIFSRVPERVSGNVTG